MGKPKSPTYYVDWKRERRAEIRGYIAGVKAGRRCQDCGQEFPARELQFDHVPDRGEKLFEIAHFGRVTVALGKVKAEIAKCDLVCHPCHINRTRDRGQFNEESRPVSADGFSPYRAAETAAGSA